MKKLKQFFEMKLAGFLSFALILTILSSCSSDNQNQSNQETAQAEVTTQPQTSANTQEEQVTPVSAENEVAGQPENTEKQPSPTAQAPAATEPAKPVISATSLSYKEWDADGNSVLNKDEFYGGFYKVWDENRDNIVNQDEFNAAAENFFSKNSFTDYGQFNDWDQDGNNEISKQEFRNAMMNLIDIDENQRLAQQLFIIWDQDNDDKIERVELDNVTVRLDEDNN